MEMAQIGSAVKWLMISFSGLVYVIAVNLVGDSIGQLNMTPNFDGFDALC